jgi:hypothetical protein
MDLSGRFNFWQVLLQTRTVIPPRLRESRWLRWVVVLLLVVAGAGTALRYSLERSSLQATVVDRPPVNAVSKPVSRAPSW